jgi:DNA helicase II / ATP-dependent DNA helicase PcrA
MPHNDTDAIVAGLNDEQISAVAAPFSEPVLALAGAGCGKTTVLTRRIAYLAREFCSPDAILALTFTRAAAREMAERASAFTGGNPETPPFIATFHSFCLRLLLHTVDGAPLYTRLGYRTRPRLVSEKRRFRMIAAASTREERLALCADVIELSAMLARRAVLYSGNLAQKPEVGAVLTAVGGRYATAKKEAGLWEYSDFISEAIALLEKHPQAAARFLSRFRAILVDEFQDTNPAQVLLLQKILAPGMSLFAVGDDDQAIYGFQGADRAAVLDFGVKFPGASILKLQTNYRSTPAILAAANRIFRKKPKAFRKVLVAGVAPAEKPPRRRAVTKAVFKSEESMVAWLAAEVEGLVVRDKIAPSAVAVLFRLNQTLDRVKTMLASTFGSREERPQFLTVHGSKGREFEAVFLCDLEEGVFPKKQTERGRATWLGNIAEKPGIAGDDGESTAEERRLFYVGVTRAKRFLWLVSVKRKELYGRTRNLVPSRFVRLI